MRSHYLYESIFTSVGLQGAHEKGGVEGEVGRLRRNHLVPVPAVGSISQLNELLLGACEHDLARRIQGRSRSRGCASRRPSVPARSPSPIRIGSLRDTSGCMAATPPGRFLTTTSSCWRASPEA
jgi:hypothetical protein